MGQIPGAVLKKYRLDLGLNQEELGDRVGLVRTTIGRLENSAVLAMKHVRRLDAKLGFGWRKDFNLDGGESQVAKTVARIAAIVEDISARLAVLEESSELAVKRKHIAHVEPGIHS